MQEIITVQGIVSPADLGFCQCHEHLLLRKGASYDINPALWMDDIDKSTQEVQRFRTAGGNTIIDAQPLGCGRMADGLLAIARETGVHIIASTGFHKLCFYPPDHWIYSISLDTLAELFIEELTVGMYTDGDTAYPSRQCAAKAGIIKTAYDSEELSSRYQTLFLAAVKAAKKTDRVISVHIEQNTDPLKLLNFLEDSGIAPNRLIFCHMDRACGQLSTHCSVLERGAYLEYDTIGRFKYHSDAAEIKLMQDVIEKGYGKQLLFSLDTTRERLKTYHPDAVGLDYILRTFLPEMKSAGIKEETIAWISHYNCSSVLANQKGGYGNITDRPTLP